MVVDPVAYHLAYDALTHSGPASVSRFDKSFCTGLKNNTLLSLDGQVAFDAGVADDLTRLSAPAPGDVSEEPPLKVSEDS